MSRFLQSALRNKTRLATLAIFAELAAGLIRPVYAQEPATIATINDIVPIIKNIIKLLAPVAGIAFFIMMIVGGFQFVTSGGDPKAAGAARNTLTFAVIGIILVATTWLILNLVHFITGVDVTNVQIPP